MFLKQCVLRDLIGCRQKGHSYRGELLKGRNGSYEKIGSIIWNYISFFVV